MRLFVTASVLAGSVLLAGCASPGSRLALEPIGPAPTTPSSVGSSGTLVVFSAFRRGADFSAPPYRREYSDYRIFSPDGKLLQWVPNDSGTLEATPKPVPLPMGTYHVVARANGYGEVTVPVVIRPNQTTFVHLEGSPAWPHRQQLAASNPVRLPNGQIAGWRAGVNNSSTP